ncbi:MAG: hypothetical protein KVP17_002005 [Porospora cf. gigantea B]|nr:MAG: hypothetical protein KVP17_002005 [Porospora cf. gigantea B]
MNALQQESIDDRLVDLEPLEAKDVIYPILMATSVAVARAGAATTKLPLYQYISHLKGPLTSQLVMPNLRAGLVSNRNQTGRFFWRAISVTAPTTKASVAANLIATTALRLKSQLSKKGLAIGVDERGTYPLSLDLAECLDICAGILAPSCRLCVHMAAGPVPDGEDLTGELAEVVRPWCETTPELGCLELSPGLFQRVQTAELVRSSVENHTAEGSSRQS